MTGTLRDMLAEAAEGDVIVACTLSEEELDKYFCEGGFTAWSERYVYFPAGYDGGLWVSRTPRHPCDERTPIQGG